MGSAFKGFRKGHLRTLALKQWRGMIRKSLDAQVVVTQRTPTSVVEPMEPRYLLSGDLMVVPPAPQQMADASLIDLSLEAEKALQGAVAVQSPTDTVEADTVVDQVIFVDTRVENSETLIQQALASTSVDTSRYEVVYLDSEGDGVEQIAQWLSRYEGLDAIHLISHGSDGQINLGNTVLDSASLEQYRDALSAWGGALSEQGDILVYGCSVAESADGEALVQALADMTGADVAASEDVTGDSALGGDWDLEVQAGFIDASMLLDGGYWQGVLADFTSDATDQSFTGTAGDDSFVFADDWGVDTAAGSGGQDTLDFSAVTRDLVFTIDADSVTVRYAD